MDLRSSTFSNPNNRETLEFSSADLLKCGSCFTEFLLSDILVFIQHKTKYCKLEKSHENKENLLKCSNCPELFNNASSLLQHAQFIHKIDIFLENSNGKTTGLSTKCSRLNEARESGSASGTSTSTTNRFGFQTNGESHGESSKSMSSKPTSSKNEIFIDVIPSSDADMGYHRQATDTYNITVSSKSQYNFKENNNTTGAVNNNSNDSNSESLFSNKDGKFVIDQNENTSSSSNSDSNRFEEQPVKMHSSGSASGSDLKMSYEGADKRNSLYDVNNNEQERRKKAAAAAKQAAAFNCDVCNATFNQKIHLTKHSAKHTGIKPFKCTECNYSTVERSHLKVHVRVHTGEKPFKCTFCEYATAQSSTLKIHKKRHHEKTESNSLTSKESTVASLSQHALNQQPHQEASQTADFKDKSIINSTTVKQSQLDEPANKFSSEQPSNVDANMKLPLVERKQPHESCSDSCHHASPLALALHQPSTPTTAAATATNAITTPSTSTPVNPCNEQTTEPKRNFNFDSIYKDKKNLPPTKRFKNDFEKSLTLSQAQPQPPDHDATDKPAAASPNNTDNQTNRENNKLLGLAQIALQTEINGSVVKQIQVDNQQ